MVTCILEKEDYQVLESLFKTSESIEKIYQRLYKLEINGKKNSIEYRKYFDYLNISLEVEQRLYNENDMNAIKCSALLDYILKEKLLHCVSDDECIAKRNYKNANIRRVYNILDNKMHEDYEGMKDLEANDSVDETSFDKEYLDFRFRSFLVKQNIEKETNMNFLIFLNEYYNKSSFKNFRNDITRIKYYLAMINKDIESELIYNNFEIIKNVLINSNIYAYCYGMSNTDYLMLQKYFGQVNAMEQINNILKYNDLQYLDFNNSCDICIRSCLLRSYLLLLDDLTLLELNDMFKENLYKKAKEKIKHYVSESIIKDCFYNLYVDRNKQFILRLGDNKNH